MRLAAMFDFWLLISWLTIKKLTVDTQNKSFLYAFRRSNRQKPGGAVVFLSGKNLHGPAARLINGMLSNIRPNIEISKEYGDPLNKLTYQSVTVFV